MCPYLTRREGSGVLSAGSNPLMLSPRNDGISFPLTVSVGLDLGLHIRQILSSDRQAVQGLLGKLASHASYSDDRLVGA